MKKGLFILLAIIIGLNVNAQKTIKLITYNIHHGNDVNEKDKLDSIASYIKISGADIVGLVEVDSVCNRSFHKNQTACIAQKTGLHSVFVRHFSYEDGAYGLALLSKFPIIGVKRIPFPILIDSTQKKFIALLSAKIAIAKNKIVEVLVAHFDYRNQYSRINQSNFVTDYQKQLKYPVLLMGDFNAIPNTPEINILEKYFTGGTQFTKPTYPSDLPSKKIDYILASKSAGFLFKNEKVEKVTYSDHCPFYAEIKWEK